MVRGADTAAVRGGDRSAATARFLEQQAVRLFAEKGYDATSVQEVVEAAGLTKGAMYHHFRSKDDLLHDIISRVVTETLERASRIVDVQRTATDALRALIVDLMEMIDVHRPEVLVYFRDRHRLTSPHRAELAADRERYDALIRGVIERGQRDGCFRPDVSAPLAARALAGMCHWVSLGPPLAGAATGRSTGDEVAELFLAAVARPAQVRAARRRADASVRSRGTAG